jgi:hypothetical protein
MREMSNAVPTVGAWDVKTCFEVDWILEELQKQVPPYWQGILRTLPVTKKIQQLARSVSRG